VLWVVSDQTFNGEKMTTKKLKQLHNERRAFVQTEILKWQGRHNQLLVAITQAGGEIELQSLKDYTSGKKSISDHIHAKTFNHLYDFLKGNTNG